MNDTRPRFRSKADRDLMALALALDPTMLDSVRELFRKGVRNIRADHMYVFNHQTGKYDYLPDPCAWMGDINQHVGIMLLKGSSGLDRNDPRATWWLNGF